MDKMYFGRVARCHQYVEEMIARICEALADKASDPLVKNLAKIVSLDSRKHGAVLSDIADLLGVEKFPQQECSRYSGAAYGFLGYLREVMAKVDSLKSDEEILETLEGLLDMLTSIAMTDRSLVTEGLEGELRSYFIELMMKTEDDEFRHIALIKMLRNRV